MLNKTLIPSENSQFIQFLSSQYNQSGAAEDFKAAIEKKLTKTTQNLKNKIVSSFTISEYFNQLWNHPDLKENDKENVIRKLEAIQTGRKIIIRNGDQLIAKVSANLDHKNSSFKISPHEEYSLQEKIKDLKQKKKLDSETTLPIKTGVDLEILHALNKAKKNFHDEVNTNVECLHYLGTAFEIGEDESLKKVKAEEFVKKIQEDKKAFNRKLRQIEVSAETRDMQEIERLRQKEKEEEDLRQLEKKKRLEAHIQELKARSEARIKESNRWEDEYKNYRNKKPLYKEIEEKYQKGYIIPELEERKKRLQEIRDFHKPLNRNEFLEHEQKMMKSLEEHTLKKRDRSEDQGWNYKKPEFESKFHRVYADEVVKVKKQQENEYQEKLKRKEKILDLMKEVKEKHLPKTDPQKELELMGLIDKIKNRNRRRDARSRTADEDEGEDEANQRRIGNDYLKQVRHLLKRKDISATPKEAVSKTRVDESGVLSDRGERAVDKKMTANSIRSEPTGLQKKRNYLAELRKENKLGSNHNQVDVIIKKKDISEQQKKELLQSEVEKLEEKAKRKEIVRKFRKQKSSLDDVQEYDEMDQIYINAIKAKLEMLGN